MKEQYDFSTGKRGAINDFSRQLRKGGVSYTSLQDLLAAGKWKEADDETTRAMLQAAERGENGRFRVLDIRNFSCEDLRIIDQLWLSASKGKFGFSVQREIYESLGGTSEYNEVVWNKFGDRLGWRKGGQWVYWRELREWGEDETLDFQVPPRPGEPRNVYLPAASNIEVPPREPPNAHLPAALFEITNTLEGKWKGGMESFSRAKACNPWNITISGLLSSLILGVLLTETSAFHRTRFLS